MTTGKLERPARFELASLGWKPKAQPYIPRPQYCYLAVLIPMFVITVIKVITIPMAFIINSTIVGCITSIISPPTSCCPPFRILIHIRWNAEKTVWILYVIMCPHRIGWVFFTHISNSHSTMFAKVNNTFTKITHL